MRSIKFPRMFNTSNVQVWKSSEYLEQTKQAIMLTLLSERNELFCDPAWGLYLRSLLFEQNSLILQDKLIDMIYKQLALFVPQITVERKDIEITPDRGKGRIYCTFICTNQIDYTVNTFQLLLFDQNEAKK